jgi:hypothetical protein
MLSNKIEKDTKYNFQHNNYVSFKYSLISKIRVNYHTISDSNFRIIETKNINFGLKNQTTLDIKEIDKEYRIYLHNYNFHEDIYPYYRDKIFILDKSYYIDSLLYNKKFNSKSKPLHLAYMIGYKFWYNNKSYIGLYFNNLLNPTSNPNYYVILFDITDKNNIKIIATDEQASYNIDCFGDFNGDGFLDFAYWYYYTDTLKCYTIKNNTLNIIKDKYLVLKESENRYKIDINKSKWFFEIK